LNDITVEGLRKQRIDWRSFVKVNIKELDGLYRELEVQVPADRFKQEMEKEFEDVRKKVTLKGFRRGKAPMNVIKSSYADSVRMEVVEKLIKSTYPDAVTSQTLKVASPPQVSDLKFGDDGGFTYKAKVEVFPEVSRVNFDKLELVDGSVEVTDDEVNNFIEMLRERRAEFRELTRPIKGTDTIMVDLVKAKDPKLAIKQTDFPDTTIDLSSSLTVDEFREGLLGLSVGDEKEITVKYKDDYTDKALAGAEITYKAKVKAVKEKVLPEVNDTFANTVANVPTVLELRVKASEELKRQKNDAQNKQFKSEIIRQMNEFNKVPVPDSVVQHYLEHIIEDLKQQRAKFEEKEIQTSYRPIAEETIRWQILYHKLAEQEKIEVLPSDVENVINKMAAAYKITPEQAKQVMVKTGRGDDIQDSLLEEKVLDLLVGRAKKIKGKK
jgi:trigger factor